MKETIRIYICDDQSEFLLHMEQKIRACADPARCYEIETFPSGGELLRRWSKTFSDVVFLDIDMPGQDGFDVASRLAESNSEALIIFVTNYDDGVYQVWEYQPFWFIRKSHLDDLRIVFPKLLSRLDSDKQKEKRTCLLKNDCSAIEIDINLLVTIECQKHDLIVKDASENIQIFRCKIADASAQLLPYYVLRIQKGILVNCRYISRVTSREVVLLDGRSISIGRNRVTDVRNQFQNYLRSTECPRQ